MVPKYENLTIAKMLEFSKQYPIVKNYLPDEEDIHRLPRDYIADLIYSLVGTPFEAWVHAQMKERNVERVATRKENIELLPEFKEAWEKSTFVTGKLRNQPEVNALLDRFALLLMSIVEKRGTSHYILKSSAKRRRTKEQIKAARAAAEKQDAILQKLHEQNELLLKQNELLKGKVTEQEDYKQVVMDLCNAGAMKVVQGKFELQEDYFQNLRAAMEEDQ
jgi:hypothetical protein